MQATARMASVVSSTPPARRRLIRNVRPRTNTPSVISSRMTFAARNFALSVWCAVFAAAAVPFTYILHESGHYVLARWQGHTPIFTYNAVLVSGSFIPDTNVVAIALGGPVVDLFLTALGILGLIRFSRASSPAESLPFWISTALTLRAIHWFAMPFVAESDESRISVLLGLPHWLFPSFWLPVAIAALVVTLRVHFRLKTMLQLGIHVVACIMVSYLYMAFIGPRLFPRP
jgi:hypothetical protein